MPVNKINNRSTSDVIESTKHMLCELSAVLTQNQQDSTTTASNNRTEASSLLDAVHSHSTPATVASLLAPRLFAARPNNNTSEDESAYTLEEAIGSDEALSILALLISTKNPSTNAKYLLAISSAVRNVAAEQQTRIGNSEAFVVSDSCLSALVGQLLFNGESSTQIAEHATATLVILARKLATPFTTRAIVFLTVAWNRAITAYYKASNEHNSLERNGYSTSAIRCASTILLHLAPLGDTEMTSALSPPSNNTLEDDSRSATDITLKMLTDTSDLLMQITILDLLEQMATTLPMHGVLARWLCSRSVLNILLPMAGGVEGGDPDTDLGGSALRVLSTLCKLNQRDASMFGLDGANDDSASSQSLLMGFHRALHAIYRNSTGESDRMAFVDAVSSFALASPDAMSLILDDPILRTGWLNLAVANPKLKAVVLLSVARVLDPPVEIDANGDRVNIGYVHPSNQTSMKLYESLGTVNHNRDDATEVVLRIAKSPFIEMRLGAYELLRAVAANIRTGAQVLLSHGEFFPFLMNRETEIVKEGKEAKHEIVVAILKSDARGLLADSAVKKLEELMRQGPHYVRSVPWELAMEE